MIKSFTTLISALALAASPALAQGGFLGVALEPAADGAAGARISQVQERSAAAIMGLRTGDLVTAVDGEACADAAALTALIGSRLPGDIVELDLVRDGAAQKLLGVLARRPGARSVRLRPDPAERMEFGNDLQLDLQNFQPMLLDLEPQMLGLRMRLQDLNLDQAKLLEQVREQLGQMQILTPEGAQGFSFRWDGEPGQVFLQPGMPLKADESTKVQLRYPESTLPEERERLRQQAVEKYGEQVEVEFAGTGTSISIQRQSTGSSAGAGAGAAPAAPAGGKNREF